MTRIRRLVGACHHGVTWPFRRARVGRHRAGLVLLTEAVLALTIMLIGILGMVALFARTREKEAQAVAETRAAMFADLVLGTLRAEDARWSASGTWHRSWDDFDTGYTTISLAEHQMWANHTSLVVRANATNALDFKIYHVRQGEDTGHSGLAIEYHLDVDLQTNGTHELDRAEITLTVAPSRYARRPFVFPTAFYRTEGG